MANTYLTRTPSSTSNKKTFTFSVWFKLSKVSGDLNLLSNNGASDTRDYISLEAGKLRVASYSGGYVYNLYTNRVFRDTSAWYHLVVAFDTTQSTSSNRIKIYVNGVQETSFNTASYPSQNLDTNYNKTSAFWIARDFNGIDYFYFNGSMSHLHFCDGQQLAPTVFGETDATTGEWKIKTSPTFTPGTNGFTILKDGNTITDQSANSNNFSLGGGILTKTEDCPSNVFPTWNPNLAMNSTMTLANGNTTGTTGSNYAAGASNCWFSTIGVSSGKWYAEFKESAGTNNQGQQLGIGYDLSKFQQGSTVSAYNIGYIAEGWGYLGSEGRVVNNNSTSVTGLSTWTIGDVIGIALDMDNHKLYFRKNGGSWENSGNPESGSTGTGAISLTTGETYFFGCSDASLANTYTFQANFGNGFFGTTAVSSAGTNASGNGIFEYDVPSGYTALSTKGLNT